MTTVKTFIENNDDTKIRLNAKESRDLYDPLVSVIYEGMLKAIPHKYHDLEVLSEGWGIDANMNVLSVYAPELM